MRELFIKEVQAKSILNVSKVYAYAINPYTGCQHGCSYCYARFTKRFSGHREPWDEFVDVKINAPDLLRVEISKKRRGNVWVSGVCDPFNRLTTRTTFANQTLPEISSTKSQTLFHSKISESYD